MRAGAWQIAGRDGERSWRRKEEPALMMMTLNKRFYTVDFCAFCNFARCIALDLCAKRYNDTSAGVRTEDGGWTG